MNDNNYLFGNILYENDEKLSNFIESISLEQSLYIINLALEMAHSKGAYDLQESEILSKSLRILKKNLFDDKRTDNK